MLTLKKKFIKVGKKVESSTTKGQKKTEKSIPIYHNIENQNQVGVQCYITETLVTNFYYEF
jgi:hypothetical protein